MSFPVSLQKQCLLGVFFFSWMIWILLLVLLNPLSDQELVTTRKTLTNTFMPVETMMLPRGGQEADGQLRLSGEGQRVPISSQSEVLFKKAADKSNSNLFLSLFLSLPKAVMRWPFYSFPFVYYTYITSLWSILSDFIPVQMIYCVCYLMTFISME